VTKTIAWGATVTRMLGELARRDTVSIKRFLLMRERCLGLPAARMTTITLVDQYEHWLWHSSPAVTKR
jgi:hypothetical protein